MDSIRDRSAPASSVEADAIGLVRSRGRFEPPAGSKQRVRARILEHRPEEHKLRSRSFVSLVVAIAVVFAVGTSAALGRHWVARTYRMLAAGLRGEVPAGAPPAVPPGSIAAPSGVATDSTGHPSSQALPPVNDPEGVLDPSTVEVPSPEGPTGAGSRASSSSHAPRALGEDGRLVFEAMRAMRKSGQPERAARALDEYLRRHPDGDLAEEALALSIEAASAENDPRAADLASRYLAKYPAGRFRQAAERARARFAP